MKCATILTALALASCMKTTPPSPATWEVATRVALPTGAALMPINPAQPGIPAAQGVVWSNGQVYVALANLYGYQPAGPSFISVHDDATLALQTLVPLTAGSIECMNAGSIRLAGSMLLVACAGSVSLPPDPPANQGVLVEFSLSPPAVQLAVTTGGSPGSALEMGNNIWLGDLETPNLSCVDATTGTLLNGPGAMPPVQVCMSGYVSDLAEIDGRSFASCFNDNTVQEFDPATGATVGAPLNVGDGPVHMTATVDRIVVVDSLSGTLSFVFPETPPSATREAVLVAGAQGGDDVEGVAFGTPFVAAADSGFGTLVLFDTNKDYDLVTAVDMKDTPTSPANDPYGVAAGNGAFFVSIAGFGQPGELVRVAQVMP